MNPLDIPRQIMAAVCAVALIALSVWLWWHFDDAAKYRETVKADAAATASAKAADKRQDVKDKAARAAEAKVIADVNKQSTDLKAGKPFDAAARAEYFRLWRDALSDAQ